MELFFITDHNQQLFFYFIDLLFLDSMKKSLVSGILNVVTGLIIFLHVSRHMNGLSLSFLSAMKGQYILWSLMGDSSAHLDLLRLASAAAAWRSWVDLLTGTPNTAL